MRFVRVKNESTRRSNSGYSSVVTQKSGQCGWNVESTTVILYGFPFLVVFCAMEKYVFDGVRCSASGTIRSWNMFEEE